MDALFSRTRNSGGGRNPQIQYGGTATCFWKFERRHESESGWYTSRTYKDSRNHHLTVMGLLMISLHMNKSSVNRREPGMSFSEWWEGVKRTRWGIGYLPPENNGKLFKLMLAGRLKRKLQQKGGSYMNQFGFRFKEGGGFKGGRRWMPYVFSIMDDAACSTRHTR